MENEVFTSSEQITPEWLTNCVRLHGALPFGQVASIPGTQKEIVLSAVIGFEVKSA
jgi:hypothetical protein